MNQGMRRMGWLVALVVIVPILILFVAGAVAAWFLIGF